MSRMRGDLSESGAVCVCVCRGGSGAGRLPVQLCRDREAVPAAAAVQGQVRRGITHTLWT